MYTLLALVSTVLVCALRSVSCAHDLSEDYPFKATLNTAEKGGLYELYWTFDNAAETISFAVRVQTMGWVGFGISPNGQMPNSDVIMGWVDNGQTFLQDRFATSRSPPPVDKQQDWRLVNGEEEGGFTVLEFTRKYITCDDYDLPITTETAKVIWSFHDTTDPSSEDITFDLIHTYKGSISLNLLGGLPSAAPDPDDLRYFDITVDNITIPSDDTTYWCAAFKLPDNVIAQTRYITKFSPEITEGNEAHVHHLLVYLCDSLNDEHVGESGVCFSDVAREVQQCSGDTLIAGWAVGGEVFVYPDNVAFPIGGQDAAQYVVMELHYDNPDMITGTNDSSGIRFHYTSTQREFDAGIMEIGHEVHPFMIIPPGVGNYTVAGICATSCISQNFPEGGIHIFANLLHTHEVGYGLTLQHLRYNSEEKVYEELKPIDRNLQYDFNYQQFTHLPRTITILPGDILLLKCFYNTSNVSKTTLGGLSTRDEMCLSFPVYYPKIPLTVCWSKASRDDLNGYVVKNFPRDALDLLAVGRIQEGLDKVNWTADAVQGVETAWLNATQEVDCDGDDVVSLKIPDISIPYVPLDQCVDVDAGVVLKYSMAILLVLPALALAM